MQSLREAYPGAADAVELCEHLRSWDMFRRCAAIEGIDVLKERMRQSAQTAMVSSEQDRAEVIRIALTQWDHPDFLSYLKGKVGAC